MSWLSDQIDAGEVADPRENAGLISKLLESGGATLTAKGERFEGSGYAVADPDLTATGITTADQVALWLNSEPVRWALRIQRRYIGKWTDSETGITEINVTDIFPRREDALKLGRERLQKAIGHIINGVYIEDILV